jgi:hypothetical protein
MYMGGYRPSPRQTVRHSLRRSDVDCLSVGSNYTGIVLVGIIKCSVMMCCVSVLC